MIRLFRVILPVTGIDHAARFYAALLGMPGQRVSGGRHYFDCGGTILACYDPRDDGDDCDALPNPDHIYFATDDIEAVHQRAVALGCRKLDKAIRIQPWSERSFYATDPWGKQICFVDTSTCFTGGSRQ